MNKTNSLTHIAGTFLIQADAAFLNGAGLGEGEDRTTTVVKTFRDHGNQVPYVSAQAWKRWLRNTLIAETGWQPSEIRAIGESERGTTSKISGELNPIDFAEDDIFGYMRAEKGQGRKKTVEVEEDEEQEQQETQSKKTKSLMRSSPFAASLLVSTRKKNSDWQGKDEGFVHLKEGTPLPYTTQFYTTNLQAVFCLAYSRLGLFWNVGDRLELDPKLVEKYLDEKRIVEREKVEREENGKKRELGKIYELVDANTTRKERAGGLLKALAVLRGGAKQAQFGVDVAPKLLILAGLSGGNPIFNHLFSDEREKGLTLKIETFKEVITDYGDRISTPIFVGLRKGYLQNENEVYLLASKYKIESNASTSTKSLVQDANGTIEIKVMTPREAAEAMAGELK